MSPFIFLVSNSTIFLHFELHARMLCVLKKLFLVARGK